MKPTNMRFEFSYLLHSINLRKYGHDSTANIHTQVLSWQALHHTTPQTGLKALAAGGSRDSDLNPDLKTHSEAAQLLSWGIIL